MCVWGIKAFASVVGDFDMMSAVTMCPMAGKHSLAFRLLNEVLLLDVSQVV